eukprot:CAMPEP_0197639058 /NCGR_PEP_ID=MMETSP1338-20131121/13801_1 /TAXON_ID=43686 ORGANISM="Pelagodinium beii, Strain RCC1491" /NCGR_SAMPLE_ID=MMETSP1338 /ASSEMBLY_ACC=CAM_ASM_000754 /LENGTH=58 /DNA_ID=CAMNT_0043211733 /DNA_START=344 /DNA_END=520 /DNA_ORIENTATION=+
MVALLDDIIKAAPSFALPFATASAATSAAAPTPTPSPSTIYTAAPTASSTVFPASLPA